MADAVPPLREQDSEDEEIEEGIAMREMKEVTKGALIVKRGKTAPPWSVPGQIWQMIFKPEYNRVKSQARFRMHSTVDKEVGRRVVKQVLKHKALTRRVLMSAHRSQACQVPKAGVKYSVRGSSLIHILDPFWRLQYKKAYYRHKRAHPRLPYYAYGGIQHRRREGATLVTHVTTWRVKKAHRSFSACSHDMQNAYGSTSQECMQEENELRVDEGTRHSSSNAPFGVYAHSHSQGKTRTWTCFLAMEGCKDAALRMRGSHPLSIVVSTQGKGIWNSKTGEHRPRRWFAQVNKWIVASSHLWMMYGNLLYLTYMVLNN